MHSRRRRRPPGILTASQLETHTQAHPAADTHPDLRVLTALAPLAAFASAKEVEVEEEGEERGGNARDAAASTGTGLVGTGIATGTGSSDSFPEQLALTASGCLDAVHEVLGVLKSTGYGYDGAAAGAGPGAGLGAHAYAPNSSSCGSGLVVLAGSSIQRNTNTNTGGGAAAAGGAGASMDASMDASMLESFFKSDGGGGSFSATHMHMQAGAPPPHTRLGCDGRSFDEEDGNGASSSSTGCGSGRAAFGNINNSTPHNNSSSTGFGNNMSNTSMNGSLEDLGQLSGGLHNMPSVDWTGMGLHGSTDGVGSGVSGINMDVSLSAAGGSGAGASAGWGRLTEGQLDIQLGSNIEALVAGPSPRRTQRGGQRRTHPHHARLAAAEEEERQQYSHQRHCQTGTYGEHEEGGRQGLRGRRASRRSTQEAWEEPSGGGQGSKAGRGGNGNRRIRGVEQSVGGGRCRWCGASSGSGCCTYNSAEPSFANSVARQHFTLVSPAAVAAAAEGAAESTRQRSRKRGADADTPLHIVAGASGAGSNHASASAATGQQQVEGGLACLDMQLQRTSLSRDLDPDALARWLQRLVQAHLVQELVAFNRVNPSLQAVAATVVNAAVVSASGDGGAEAVAVPSEIGGGENSSNNSSSSNSSAAAAAGYSRLLRDMEERQMQYVFGLLRSLELSNISSSGSGTCNAAEADAGIDTSALFAGFLSRIDIPQSAQALPKHLASAVRARAAKAAAAQVNPDDAQQGLAYTRSARYTAASTEAYQEVLQLLRVRGAAQSQQPAKHQRLNTPASSGSPSVKVKDAKMKAEEECAQLVAILKRARDAAMDCR